MNSPPSLLTQAPSTTHLSTAMASSSNASSSYHLTPVTQKPNFIKTEGFRQFCKSFNKQNTCCSHENPVVTYLTHEEIYQKAKNAGGSEQTFTNLLFKDFVGTACAMAQHKLKRILIAPHYFVQLNCCTRKWDKRVVRELVMRLLTLVTS